MGETGEHKGRADEEEEALPPHGILNATMGITTSGNPTGTGAPPVAPTQLHPFGYDPMLLNMMMANQQGMLMAAAQNVNQQNIQQNINPAPVAKVSSPKAPPKEAPKAAPKAS